MLRRALTTLLLTGALASVAATPPAAAATPATVSADLRTRLHSILGGSTAGIVSAAVDVAGLGAVLRQSSSNALLPASTEKLFTGAAVLRGLDPSSRLHTRLVAALPVVGTHQPGDVYLVGAGDPYLTSAQLDQMAADVRAAGIRAIDGSLVVDDTRYDAQRQPAGWKSGFMPNESGPLSAMPVDRNAWRRDATYLADPDLPNLDLLRQDLLRHGVAVSSSLHRGAAPAGARVVAEHASMTVRQLVSVTEKNSVNFAAELLLKEVGKVVRGTGSTSAGLAAMRSLLPGVPVGTVTDGSGLSLSDRQTATNELSLLSSVEGTSAGQALWASLPVACVDGTLKTRMCSTAAAGRVHAKTGTLDGMRALSGWTTTADGRKVRFALLLGRYTDATKASKALDAAAVLLSGARVGS